MRLFIDDETGDTLVEIETDALDGFDPYDADADGWDPAWGDHPDGDDFVWA